MRGCGMSSEYTEWAFLTPEAADSKVVDSRELIGYVTDSRNTQGVFLCACGGQTLTVEDGVPSTWTLHLYRTHGLPTEGLFTDPWDAQTGTDMKRFARGQGLADAEDHLSLFASMSPMDLKQGGIGNCWLISALAAAAECPEQLMKLCKQQKLAADGRYDIKLYHPLREEWQHLTITDALPVAGGRLRYCDLSADGEVWPCLFEKAVAKLFGGYDQLDGNNSLLALKTLFGVGGDELLALDRADDGKWRCHKPKFEALGHTVKVSAEWPDGFGDGEVARPMDDSLFELLEDFDETGCIMCCSTGPPPLGAQWTQAEGHSGESILASGMVMDHTYTLLRCVDNVAGSGIDLIEMRNPWGECEWKGPWSDGHSMWKKYPQVFAELQPHFDQHDGKFWIRKEDFLDNFESISICLSAEMTARYDAAKAAAQEKARAGLANFVAKPGHGMDSSYAAAAACP